MQPSDIQLIGTELALRWPDGTETFIPLEKLRRGCPCAECKGEVDVMGQLHKGPEKVLRPSSFQLARLERVGTYALQPVWADGHSAGIYPFEYLKKLGG